MTKLKQEVKKSFKVRFLGVLDWLREEDLNLRPSGYEPDELPNCSIPRYGVDGVEGLEPPNDWTKTSCLTTWRYPNSWDI